MQAAAGPGDPLRGQVQDLRDGPGQAVRGAARARRRPQQVGGEDPVCDWRFTRGTW